jgi:PST family polysaccharide transporter
MKSLFSPVVSRNIGALLVLHFGNYLLPLVLVPYLIRVLGFSVFGQWMFAMAFVVMARICVSYGFDLTATRQVASLADGQSDGLSELLSDVIFARILIWSACYVVVLGLSYLLVDVAQVRVLLAVAMVILVGEVLFPVWLFQGMQTMGVVTYLRLGAKVLNLFLVVLLIKGPKDLLLVPLLEAATAVAAGAMALVWAKRRFALSYARPTLGRLQNQLLDGWAVFISSLAVQFYTTINLIVLGLLIDSTAVGAYALAEKIYSAIRGLLSPFVNAIFPAMAQMHEFARESFSSYYKRVLQSLVPVLVFLGVVVFFLSPIMIYLVSGQSSEIAVITLQIFALSLPFAIGSFLSPMLVVRRRNVQLMRITIVGALLGISCSPLLSIFYGAAGAAGAFLLVQVYNSSALVLANRS